MNTRIFGDERRGDERRGDERRGDERRGDERLYLGMLFH